MTNYIPQNLVIIMDNKFPGKDISIDDLIKRLRFDNLVIGASNWQNNIDQWIKDCKRLGIDYVDIKNTKALVIDV